MKMFYNTGYELLSEIKKLKEVFGTIAENLQEELDKEEAHEKETHEEENEKTQEQNLKPIAIVLAIMTGVAAYKGIMK
jgi:hypothetical protein